MCAARVSLPPAVKDITKYVRINKVSEYQYQEAGFGGSADIFWYALLVALEGSDGDFGDFSGTYTQERGSILNVSPTPPSPA